MTDKEKLEAIRTELLRIKEVRGIYPDIMNDILAFIDSLPASETDGMKKVQTLPYIIWTGNNLFEVLGFTGKYRRFGEWFKSFDEYERYVYSHGSIFKIFTEDGDHYDCPVGTMIVKTPGGRNYPIGIPLTRKGGVWHDAGERPETTCARTAWVTDNGMMYTGWYSKDAFGHEDMRDVFCKFEFDAITKWAYVDDLLKIEEIPPRFPMISQKEETAACGVMTLDEAIEHCHENACGDSACAKDHAQLEEWLRELKSYRSLASKELDDAAEECVDAEDYPYKDDDGNPLYTSDYMEYMFKMGAQWHEAQLLKNSVVTQIRELPSIDKADERVIIIKDTKKKLDMSDYAVGDRVRIVFIKTKED